MRQPEFLVDRTIPKAVVDSKTRKLLFLQSRLPARQIPPAVRESLSESKGSLGWLL